MATYLTVLNDVLTRLRRGTVNSVSDSSVALIGALVNQAKREVEDSFKWNGLRTSLDLSVVQSTSEYSLTDFRDRFLVQKVWNTTDDIILYQADPLWIEKQREFGSNNEGRSFYWAISGVDSSGDPQIDFYPTPSAAVTIRVWAHRPQADLTGNTEQMLVPSLPVVLKAYQLALQERGEDGGTHPSAADLEFNRALDNAIARENMAIHGGHQTDWYVARGPRA